MATLAQVRAWRDRLFESRLNGIREIEDQNGERVVYKSDSELDAAIRAADRFIADMGGKPPNTIRFQTSKGL